MFWVTINESNYSTPSCSGLPNFPLFWSASTDPYLLTKTFTLKLSVSDTWAPLAKQEAPSMQLIATSWKHTKQKQRTPRAGCNFCQTLLKHFEAKKLEQGTHLNKSNWTKTPTQFWKTHLASAAGVVSPWTTAHSAFVQTLLVTSNQGSLTTAVPLESFREILKWALLVWACLDPVITNLEENQPVVSPHQQSW